MVFRTVRGCLLDMNYVGGGILGTENIEGAVIMARARKCS